MKTPSIPIQMNTGVVCWYHWALLALSAVLTAWLFPVLLLVHYPVVVFLLDMTETLSMMVAVQDVDFVQNDGQLQW